MMREDDGCVRLWLRAYVDDYLKGREMRRRLKEDGDDQETWLR